MTQAFKQHIAIIGMGQTGLSMLRCVCAHQRQVVLFDTRASLPAQTLAQIHAIAPDAPLHLGTLADDALLEFDQVLLSPGVALATPAIAAAQVQGIEIIGDVGLLQRLDQRPRLLITGSNGKSTVTSLLTAMIEQAGAKAIAAGNIGLPVLDTLDMPADWLVLELSSFQLETTPKLSAKAATVLNISPDHMDRYADLTAYRDAKHAIYRDAQVCVFNADDAQTQPDTAQLTETAQQCAFSLLQPAAWHVQSDAQQMWLAYQNHKLMPVAEMAMVGDHNVANALAALALYQQTGLPLEAALQTLRSFNALPHRCQLIANHHGVRWVNDSKATNEGAALAAIQGLRGHVNGQLILLAGGDGKGTDFAMLSDALAQQVDVLICFGRDGRSIAALKAESQYVENLQQAVTLAHLQAKAGDLVLLSPACASLDQFANFAARGDAFVQWVAAVNDSPEALV